MSGPIASRDGVLTLKRNLSETYRADDPKEREALVDLALLRPDERWSILLEFHPADDTDAPSGRSGYLMVGVAGDAGAAILYRVSRSGASDGLLLGTIGPDPSAEPSRAILDQESNIFFRRDRLIPKDELRTVMVEYALTGDVEEAARLTSFDYDVDAYQAPIPESAIKLRWTSPGVPDRSGDPPF